MRVTQAATNCRNQEQSRTGMDPKSTIAQSGRFHRPSLSTVVLLTGLLLSPGFCTAEDSLRHIVLQLRWHHRFQVCRLLHGERTGPVPRCRPRRGDSRRWQRHIAGCRGNGGRADFGIDGSGLLVERAQGRNVVVLAAIFQKSPLRLIARADHGIRRITDLAERKVMLLRGFRSLALVAMLDQVGLLDKIVRIDSSTEIHDLISGNVDAFNAYKLERTVCPGAGRCANRPVRPCKLRDSVL